MAGISAGVISNRRFRRYWLGQVTSRFGNALVPIATAFAILHSGGTAVDIGLVLATGVLAEVLSLVFGGVWSDRLPRQLVMISADSLRALSQGTLAVLLLSGQAEVWHFAMATGLHGVAQGFFLPAASGLVFSLVRKDQLRQANSLLSIAGSAAAITGPALAGLLVASNDNGSAIAIGLHAASFAFNVVMLSGLRTTHVPPAERQTFLADLLHGWREVTSRRWLVSQIAWDASAGALIGAPLLVLGPVIAERTLGGASAWGVIVACFPIGAVIGGLIALRWRPTRPLLAAAIFLPPCMALPAAALALGLPVPFIAATEVVAGAATAVSMANWATIVQQHIPSDKLSRVTSNDAMASYALLPLGYALAGPVSGIWGDTTTLWVTVAWALVSGALLLCVRSIRTVRFAEDLAPAKEAQGIDDAHDTRQPEKEEVG